MFLCFVPTLKMSEKLALVSSSSCTLSKNKLLFAHRNKSCESCRSSSPPPARANIFICCILWNRKKLVKIHLSGLPFEKSSAIQKRRTIFEPKTEVLCECLGISKLELKQDTIYTT